MILGSQMSKDNQIVKCNSGHENHRALWDCPVCVGPIKEEHLKFKKALEEIDLYPEQPLSIEYFEYYTLEHIEIARKALGRELKKVKE